jgi:predicted PurR-regulated permease PerM
MAKFFSHPDAPEVALTITARTFFKVLLLIVVTMVLLSALKSAAHAIVLIVIALFLAVALNAPVSWVARHLPGTLRHNRTLATALSFLIVVAIIGAFVVSLIPPIVRQSQSLIENAPRLVQDIRSSNSQASQVIQRYHLQGQIDQLSSELSSRLQNSSGSAVSALTQIGSSIFSSMAILVLTFMMLIEGPRWLTVIRELLPAKHREQADRLARDMYKVVKGYVNGQVVLAALASLLVLPGLLIFHVSYPIALMGVVFICGLIPMVGHTIGAIIVATVAVFHSPFSGLGILIYYILYQQIETYLIQPRLQANTTSLSPLLVLMSLVVGVSFGGLVGGLVAIPVVACIRVWVVDYLHTHRHISESAAAAETK